MARIRMFSMCLGMNEDVIPSGERCASTSNRNFEGRQGAGARTHLVSVQQWQQLLQLQVISSMYVKL